MGAVSISSMQYREMGHATHRDFPGAGIWICEDMALVDAGNLDQVDFSPQWPRFSSFTVS